MTILLLLASLFLPDPQGTVIIRRAAAGTTPAEDWSDSTRYVLEFDSSGDQTPSAESCTNTCVHSDVNSSTTTTTGVDGSALVFDNSGSQDFLRCASNDSSAPCWEVGLGETVSMTGWLYFTDTTATNNVVWDYNATDEGWGLLNLTSANDLQVSAQGLETDCDTPTLSDDTWYHVAVTHGGDGTGYDIFINGVECTSYGTDNTEDQVDLSTFNEPKIGYNVASADYNGYMDQVTVWDDIELTAAEIAHIGACLVDGSECSCSGATYSDKGIVDDNCTGAQTPWECCTGSGTGCIDADALTGDCNASDPT